MSEQNLQIQRRAYERFAADGQIEPELMTDDFVWDMSNFHGWPEQQAYAGVEGARQFLSEWIAAWDDWRMEVSELHDAGDRVVAIVRQHGRSKTTGMQVEMSFAQVWTFRDGRQSLMQMYSEPEEALRAVGLCE